jgi:hypothetical protein
VVAALELFAGPQDRVLRTDQPVEKITEARSCGLQM